jgi:CubicO group peptidase (beta-lactamase class C family)
MRRRSMAAAQLALGLLVVSAQAGADPGNTGLAATVFDDALQTADEMPRLRSLLVSYGGDMVVEAYFHGAGPGDTFNVKSVSKTIMSALVGLAIDRGHLEGLDQPITDFYGETLAEAEDPRKRDITIGHLLSMQSGLETTSFYNYGAWVTSDDWVRFALEQPMLADPGTRLLYSTGNTHLLSDIITRASGRSALSFARETLTQPLGIQIAAWDRDPKGVYFGGNNMAFTPRAMHAFGRLYLDGGRRGERQVIPEDWVTLSTTPRVESGRERGRYYGYGWWIRMMAGFESPYAWGYGGQFIVLVPELDLVVVATSSSQPGSGRRAHLRGLYELIEYGLVVAAADALGEYRPAPRRALRWPLSPTD